MAADPLEEKINKIRLQNEEIRRRHEEVEADKKNAAKLNALVQMVPSTDWPERKEPPEFSSPPINKVNQKPRTARENCPSLQYRAGSDAKKFHTFGQNEGPPPDPKYNFLADAEREEHYDDHTREEKTKVRGKSSRGNFKKRGSGRDWQMKETRGKSGTSPQDSLPDYEAWRAERNKIDEARISRQRTAEGNWKREWDNDKMHLADETKRENHSTLGEAMRYPRIPDNKRIVASTEKNIQVTLNHGANASRNSLMSVKVSSPNIAGTGRVGPRQRTRMMYSSQSETETMNFEVGNFVQPKTPDEKRKNFGNSPKSDPKILHSQRRKDLEKSHSFRREQERNTGKYQRKSEGDAKSPGPNRKDFKNFQKSPHVQRRANASPNYPLKSPKINRKFGDGFHETKQKMNNETLQIKTAVDSKTDEFEINEKPLKNEEIHESKIIEGNSEENKIPKENFLSETVNDSQNNLIKEDIHLITENIDGKSIDSTDESIKIENLNEIIETSNDSVIDKPEESEKV